MSTQEYERQWAYIGDTTYRETGVLEGFMFTVTTRAGLTVEVRLQGNGGQLGAGCLGAANHKVGEARERYVQRVLADALAAARHEAEEIGEVRVVDPAAAWHEDRIAPLQVASVDSVRPIFWPPA